MSEYADLEREYADYLERWATTEGMGIEPDECEECGHPIRLHGDKYGCQYEPGDTFDGSRAKPPCGCQKEWSPDEWQYWCRGKRTATELLRIWEVLP